MTTCMRTEPASAWSGLALAVAILAALPNLRASAPAPVADPPAQVGGKDGDVPSGSGTAAADGPAAEKWLIVAEEGPLVAKIHDVKVLLQHGADPETLVELITSSILVSSWRDVGGDGTIAMDTDTGQLRITNVAGVQQATERLLGTFRGILEERSKRKPDAPFPRMRCVDLFTHHEGAPIEQRLVRVYVVPSLLFREPSQRDPQLADYDALIELTTSVIDPDSWDEVGGPGSIEPWPAGDTLVVAQTQSAHDKIARLYSLLGGMHSASTPLSQHTDSSSVPSVQPVNADLPMRNPLPGHGAGQLETKLYPVHDLLPRETQPDFSMSPRAVGLEQLGCWLVTKISPGNEQPAVVEPILANEVVLVATTTAAHQRLENALADARRRLREVSTAAQQAALDKELFPALFRSPRGFHPRQAPADQLYLYGTCDADRQLEQIARSNPQILRLQLVAADVTNAGLKSVSEFDTLSDLTVWSKLVTDEGIAHLKKLPQLQRIALHGKQLKDEAAIALSECPSLRFIDVSHTSVTDDGMRQLMKNRQWLVLDVRHTRVTPAGVEALGKAYPQVHVFFEQ